MASDSSISSSEDYEEVASTTLLGHKPLSPRAWLLIVLLTYVAVEMAVSLLHEPAHLKRAAAAYVPSREPPGDVLLMGTCRVAQVLEVSQLAESLKSGYRLVDLASPGSTPIDWALALAHGIPRDARIKAILIPYASRDLTNVLDPWEAQMMDLAHMSDLPTLLSLTCNNAGCSIDLVMRKVSPTYRYRGYIARRVWALLGVKKIDARPQLPGGLPHPERLEVEQPCARGIEANRPEPPSMISTDPDRLFWRAGDWAGEDANTTLVRAPDTRERLRAAHWAIERGDRLPRTEEYPTGYLEAFLQVTRTLGLTVYFVPLPFLQDTNPVKEGKFTPDPEALRRLLTERGAIVLDPGDVPGLEPGLALRGAGYTSPGRAAFTRRLGDLLDAALRSEIPATSSLEAPSSSP